MNSYFIDFSMKPWYASKTLWFNALTIIVAVASYFGWTPDPSLTALIAKVLVAASPAVNVVLRFATTRGIRITSPSSY